MQTPTEFLSDRISNLRADREILVDVQRAKLARELVKVDAEIAALSAAILETEAAIAALGGTVPG